MQGNKKQSSQVKLKKLIDEAVDNIIIIIFFSLFVWFSKFAWRDHVPAPMMTGEFLNQALS